jgi:serine-type D-Ala-D-Ala carboxypeptidase/endopeptidase
MRFPFATLGLALVACQTSGVPTPSVAARQVSDSAAASARIDRIVRSAAGTFIADSHSVGVSIGVYHAGITRTFDAGVTDLVSRVAPTPGTIYPIASLTKTLTGALVARAVLEGRLRLDDDVRRHLDGPYPNLEFRGHPVTIASMLTHTSRLPSNLQSPDLLLELASVSIDTIPGVSFRYSNVAYQLLGRVLERVYGRPYETLVDSLVTRPLGMSSTRLVIEPDAKARVATGYDEQRRAMPLPPAELRSAGAMSSTVEDMLQWVRWQVREADDVARLTHRPVWGDTTAWTTNRAGYAIAYNWQMLRAASGVRRIFQDGNVPGYSVLCVIQPELDLGIVILSNELDPSTPRRVGALADAILTGLDPRAAPSP